VSQFTVKKGKKEPVVKHIVLNSLKLGNHTAERVYSIVAAATALSEFMVRGEIAEERVELGRLLFEVKDAWHDGLLISLSALQAGRAFSKDEDEYINNAVARAEQIKKRISVDWKLDCIWEKLQKDPILDGTELMAFLKIKGAEVRKAVSLVRDFAFLNGHPEDSQDRDVSVARAKEYVLKHWSK